MTPGLCPHHRALVATCRLCPTYATPEAAPVAAPGPELCPVHGTPHTSFCPKCRGARGGRVVTPAKLKSLARVRRDRERNRRAKPEGGGET